MRLGTSCKLQIYKSAVLPYLTYYSVQYGTSAKPRIVGNKTVDSELCYVINQPLQKSAKDGSTSQPV